MLLSLVPAGEEFRANTFTPGSQSAAAVAADADGDFVVVWQGNGPGDTDGVFARRYAASGVPQGVEFRVNSTTADNQSAPAVAMDSDGDFVVAWSGNGPGDTTGIFAQRYNAAGVAQGGEFRVNTFTTNLQRDPAVAMSATGEFLVAWESFAQDGPTFGGIYAQRYNAAGAAQGPEFRVNTFTTGDQRAPDVAMDASGDFVVVWTSDEQDGSDEGVYAQRFNASGATQGGEFRVNTFTTDIQGLGASVAMDTSGDFVVAWTSYAQDAGPSSGIYAQRYNAAGATQDSEFRVNTFTTSLQWKPDVAMDEDGDFLIAWESVNQDGSPYGIYAQSFNAAGVAQGGEFRVNTFTTNNQTSAAVALDANGNAIVAWQSLGQDGSSTGIYAQHYAEVPLAGSEFRVNTFTTGAQVRPSMAADADGDFVIAWSSNLQDGSGYGVYAQRYNAAGVTQGDEFRVNTFTTGRQWLPAAAMDADGDFVIAWQSEGQDGDLGGIYAQRYSAAGLPQGAEFLVNAFTVSDQQPPAIAMNADGGFVVTWASFDGSDLGIFARRFDAGGVAQGLEFRVNSVTDGQQIEPAVAMDADGDFVIVWQSGISGVLFMKAQRFDASGMPQGAEFFVHGPNNFEFLQPHPAVAMDADGDFVIVWDAGNSAATGITARRFDAAGVPKDDEFLVGRSELVDDSHAVAIDADGNFVIAWANISPSLKHDPDFLILARRYDAAGNAQGPEFLVNTFTTGRQWMPAVAMDADGDFVIAWQSEIQDGSQEGIYAQRYREAQQQPPQVSAADFLFAFAPHRLRFGFDQNVSASLGADDILLENLTTQQTIPSGDLSLSYDLGTNTATFSYVGSAGGITGILSDGNYRATLLAAGITNPAGTPLAADHVFNFFFLNGDANHDGRVNLNDFNILAANFGQEPRDFTQGDFSYDGRVNLADFNILAGRFGVVLAADAFEGRAIEDAKDECSPRELLEQLL